MGWIATLLPLLFQLAQGCGKDPTTAAKDSLIPGTDDFKEEAIRAGMVQAHHAIKIDRRGMTRAERRAAGRISKDEIRRETIAAMRKGLDATPEAVAACAAQAAQLPELDYEEDGSDE